MLQGAELQVQEQVALQAYSGLATPATADYLLEVTTPEQLSAALEFAAQQEQPVLVLGEGSNSLFTKDFRGLVLLNRLQGIRIDDDDENAVLVSVAAGEQWHSFVQQALSNGWYGLENLALIPGSVGAAPMQNIGAYGVEVGQYITRVSGRYISAGEEFALTREECEFGYRDSIFKHRLAGQVVITEVQFQLPKRFAAQLSYPALKACLPQAEVSAQQVFEAVCEIRSSKLPLPSEIPNCGSFFKNPQVSAQQFAELQERYPDIVGFPLKEEGGNDEGESAAEHGVKLAAAWLIERAGWKTRSLLGVSVHQQQSLVIINPYGALGTVVTRFAQLIQRDIQQRFSVALEIEPQIF